jgi:methionyl-tRNA synthetase
VQLYERLLDRVDPERVKSLVEASKESLKATETAEPIELSVDPLVGCEFTTLQVLAVESPTSGKPGYLRLRLEGNRTVIARLGESEEFQYLIGKGVLVLANLKPKRLAADVSEGMLLAAESVEPGVHTPLTSSIRFENRGE